MTRIVVALSKTLGAGSTRHGMKKAIETPSGSGSRMDACLTTMYPTTFGDVWRAGESQLLVTQLLDMWLMGSAVW